EAEIHFAQTEVLLRNIPFDQTDFRTSRHFFDGSCLLFRFLPVSRNDQSCKLGMIRCETCHQLRCDKSWKSCKEYAHPSSSIHLMLFCSYGVFPGQTCCKRQEQRKASGV